MRKNARLTLLLPLLLGGALAAVASDAGAPLVEPTPVWITRDGAWCWFADSRALHVAEPSPRIILGWVNRQGDIQVGSYEHGTGRVETATLHPRLERDDHASPALLALPDGRIRAFYSAHNGPALLSRTSLHPGDVREWGMEEAVSDAIPRPSRTDPSRPAPKSLVRAQRGEGFTYPNPVVLPGEAGKLFLFWRGQGWRPWLSVSPDGRRWSPVQPLLEGGGGRAYVKVAPQEGRAIHIAFTDGHPRGHPTNGIRYVRYEAGAFHRGDGTRLRSLEELPLRTGEADLVHDGSGPEGRAWLWDLAVDPQGHPVVVYAVFPSRDRHAYRYARWDGRWRSHAITEAGGWFPRSDRVGAEREPYYSGGVTLDPGDPSVVYLSREVEGLHRVERWSTPDHGRTWHEVVLAGGSRVSQVRPVVPRGAPAGQAGVLWMEGAYAHFTDYLTGIRLLLHPGSEAPRSDRSAGRDRRSTP